jgi:hypothetical protein
MQNAEHIEPRDQYIWITYNAFLENKKEHTAEIMGRGNK